jgi:hypothetical protein
VRRKLHKQRRLNTCGVACVRTVLDLQYHVQVAEEALEILGTAAIAPIKQHGAGTAELRRMVKGASQALNPGTPWTLRSRRDATLADLERELAAGRYPIARVYDPTPATEYHMLVVLGVSEGTVRLWDPSPHAATRPKTMDCSAFVAWWGGDGQEQWYAVVGGGDGERDA